MALTRSSSRVGGRWLRRPPTAGAGLPGPRAEISVRRRSRRDDRPLWLMWPGMVLLFVVVLLPFLAAAYLSVLDVDQYTLRRWLRAPFIGIHNFTEALTSSNLLGASALQSLMVSVAFSLMTTAIITPIGIAAALTVSNKIRGRALLRALYLVPYVLPGFVTALVFRLTFLNGTGLVDQFLGFTHLGSRNTYWLIGPNSFWALLFADVWASWAFIYIMTLAGLQAIPRELYDAAAIDGAGSWQKLRNVVLPQLRPVLGLALLLSTLNHFNNFTLPFVMFGTPPPARVDVLPLNIFVTSFQQFRFGLGAAMAVMNLALMLIPGFFYIRAVRLGRLEEA